MKKTMKVKRAKKNVNRNYSNRIEVQSESNPKLTYIVAIRDGDKRWTCSCHRWIMFHNVNGGDCKHIKKVKADKRLTVKVG